MIVTGGFVGIVSVPFGVGIVLAICGSCFIVMIVPSRIEITFGTGLCVADGIPICV